MDDVAELVALPDRSVQPLVHPLDLAEARGPFRAAWLIELVTGPPVGLAIGALVWAVTANIVIAVIAAVPIVVVGAYVGGLRATDAWSFIPRSRQDRGRILPPAWELTAGIVDGAALVVAAVAAADRLGRSDIAEGIDQFVFGAGFAVVVLVALDLVVSLAFRRGTFVGRPWFGGPIVVALVLAIALAARSLFGDGGFEVTSTMLLGSACVVVAGVVYAAWLSFRARRGT
jgi:hypothetical protein